jgi:hypothetical protein
MNLKNMKTFEQHSSELNISDVSESKIFTDGLSTLKIINDDNNVILHLKDKDKNITNIEFTKDELSEFINHLNRFI